MSNGILHNSDEIVEMLEWAIKHILETKDIEKSQMAYYNQVRLTTRYALLYVGKFYKWGGNGPIFDCSGFACELEKMNGFISRGSDYTAGGLWDLHIKQRVAKPTEGCFVCYFNGNTLNIGHIEYCLNDTISLGASDGGSKTLTEEDAMKHNAYIKARPIKRNRNIAGYYNPFLKEK